MRGLADPQVLRTLIRTATCKPKPCLFRHREVFHGLKVIGLSAEQGGRLIKRQCTIEWLCGIVEGAKKVGFMAFGEVVCHAQILPQVIRCNRPVVGIVDVQLAGELSTSDFHFPFLL
jgi:hypothetical protein